EFKYEKNLGVAGGVPLTEWTFQTTAAQTGTVNLAYTLEGLHAWFNVTVGLRTFKNGATVETLINDGPVSCCTPPSNGFAYEGTAAIPVTTGDTIGFKITGSNGDANSFLQGKLRVATNVIKNGSFEQPVVPGPGGFKVVPTEVTIPNWTVDSGNLELLNSLYWNAADLNQSIDLDGATAAGTVSQTFATIPGQDYDVTFKYSANPEGAQPDPHMVVQANGVQLGAPFTHAKGPVGGFPRVVTWDSGSRTFTADDDVTTLTFASTDLATDVFGIAPDAGRVIPDLGTTPDVTTNVNAPYLFRADPNGSTTHVEGVLGATPNTTFHVEFRRSDGCDDDGLLTEIGSGNQPGADTPFAVGGPPGPEGRG